MSGFEVAGLVLGAIPLVISALEHYRAGKGVTSSLVKWRGHLNTLIYRLKLQRTFFYLQILDLLREARVSGIANKGDPTEDECVEILRRVETEAELEEYLGDLFEMFLEILGRYQKCLRTIASKLGNINKPPEAQKNELRAILAANTNPKTGAWAFMERFTFAIERSSLKELLEELKEDRLSLRIVIKNMKTQREHTIRDPSDEARRLASAFQHVQARAVSLFAAMSKGCRACKCRDSHNVLMRLDNRMPSLHNGRRSWKTGMRPKEDVIFHMVIPVMEKDLQEASVHARGEDDDEDQLTTTRTTPTTMTPTTTAPATTETTTTMTTKTQGVFHALLGTSPATVNVPRVTFQLDATHLQPPAQTRALVTDICQTAHAARERGQFLALDLVSGALSLRSSRPAAGGCRQFCSTTTLENFLLEGVRDEDARLTPKQQTLLALDIASSILQLSQTCWLNKPFDSQRIKFLLVPPRPASNTATAAAAGLQIINANVVGPFIEELLVLDNNRETAAGSKGKGKAVLSIEQEQQEEAGGPSPKAALLELAILLLEIWHHRPLKTWVAKAGMADIDTSRPESRRVAAIRWLEMTSERLPPHHLTAVEQCLGICSGRLRAWGEGEFRRQFCENVIRPLQESCRAWEPSTCF
ncbi:hypothetical protein RB595_003777 [Gaeumannomyces hyphopodioides]